MNKNAALKAIVLFFFVLLVSACTGPLSIKYAPRSQPSIKTPVLIGIEKIIDAREVKGDKRNIGNVASPVADYYREDIVLADDVAHIVNEAFREELKSAGFLVADKSGEARFSLSAEVRQFKIDIGARDFVEIGLLVSIVDAHSGKVVLSEAYSEKAERFAGIAGNTRKSISGFISLTLSKAIERALRDASSRIDSFGGGAVEAAGAGEAKGRIVINTEPRRAEVYLDNVYFGLTPLSVEIKQGVYKITIKQRGFKETAIQVSIRRNDTTELEIRLETAE